jgi:hypothetical protein
MAGHCSERSRPRAFRSVSLSRVIRMLLAVLMAEQQVISGCGRIDLEVFGIHWKPTGLLETDWVCVGLFCRTVLGLS